MNRLKFKKTIQTGLTGIILPIGIFLVFTTIFLLNSKYFIATNNDLIFSQGQYGFFKHQLLTHHFLPLWQNYSLSGSPFLGNPQNPLLYIFNYLVLIFPENTFFLIFSLFHFGIAFISTIFLLRNFKINFFGCIAGGIIYAFSPKFMGNLQQAHFNLLAAYAYFPLFLFCIQKIKIEKSFLGSLFLGLVTAFMFFNYPTILVYAGICGIGLLIFQNSLKNFVKQIKHLSVGIIIFIIIAFPQLIVQAKYLGLTNRNMVSLEDVGPNVVSIRHYLSSIVNPYNYGLNNLSPESIFSFGILPLFFGICGFFFVKSKNKIIILVIGLLSFFLSLGLKTNLYQILLSNFPILLSFRIVTRFWFIPILIVAGLSAVLIEKISQKSKIASLLIILAVFGELMYFFQSYLKIKYEPIVYQEKSVLVKQIFATPEYFRIYCPKNCIGDVYEFNKGLAHGYNPIILNNYFNFFQDIAGFKFNLYALSLPPYQTASDVLQPNASKAGILGIKYLLSPYPLKDKNFQAIGQVNNLQVYENLKNLPRIYFKNGDILKEIKPIKDLPGLLEIPLNNQTGKLVINEIYTPFWEAWGENGDKFEVSKFENITLEINVDKPTSILTINFLPKWIRLFIYLSLFLQIGMVIIVVLMCFKRK